MQPRLLVKVSLHQLDPLNPDITRVGFNQRLHRRGSDFKLYANTGYTPVEGQDFDLLVVVASTLMADDSGVEEVGVKSFGVDVKHSRAVSREDIQQKLFAALVKENFEVIILDENREPIVASNARNRRTELPPVQLTLRQRMHHWWSRLKYVFGPKEWRNSNK